MAEDSFRRFYLRADFTSLPGNVIPLPLLTTQLVQLNASLSQQIIDVRELPGITGVAIEWHSRPSDADLLLVDDLIADFVGGTTTSEPFELESFGATQAPNGTPVLKATLATPPLDAGTYAFNWNSQLRMNPAGASSGVEGRIRITRSDGVFREQPDAWDLTAPHAFNGSITFKVSAGQTLTATAHVLRLGGAGIAEMLGLRFTIDQLSPEAAS